MIDDTEPNPDGSPSDDRSELVFTGRLFRHGGGGGTPHQLTDKPPEPPPGPARRPALVAQMLAFAHRVEAEIAEGLLPDRSAASRHYGISTGRISQIMNLLQLSPDIQEAVLWLEAVDGREPMTGQALEELAVIEAWSEQRKGWHRLRRCS